MKSAQQKCFENSMTDPVKEVFCTNTSGFEHKAHVQDVSTSGAFTQFSN